MKKEKSHTNKQQHNTIANTSINTKALNNFQANRKKQPTPKTLVKEILNGNITALSRAITLLESTNPNHEKKATQILNACLPYANQSIRIGITGVPGVGKSTFIEAFGTYLTKLGKKVAVLAIDPSSSITKGSILGDKTRMEELVKNPNAYIRPSASGKSLGGVAQKTRESMLLCEAAGYNTIIVETVGVGQSETAVHSMVDFFLLLKLAGAGDELQGIKRGIIEMADAIAINKADGNNENNAKIAKVEFNRALHLYPKKNSGWQPKVSVCSAMQNTGVDTIWETITQYLKLTTTNMYFETNRKAQNKYWFLQTIENQLKNNFFQNKKIQKELQNQLQLVENNKVTPFAAAQALLQLK